ncbi:MAG TPA: hypothetical protein VLM40_01445 [Gemmata sp.]|nr:hypothetical protein [Gemmata sp.]
MIGCILSILLAVPANPYDRITKLKPVANDAADSALRKLQKELVNERIIAIQQTHTDREWEGPHLHWRRLFEQVRPFTEAGIALEGTPEARARWYELRVACARETERVAAGYIDAGSVRPPVIHLIRAARIDAQTDLLTHFPGADKSLLSFEDIPTRPKPNPKQQELKLPTLIADAIKPDEKDLPLVRLQKARVRERAVYLAMAKEEIENGQFHEDDLADLINAPMNLAENLAEVAWNRAGRMKVLEFELEEMKFVERFTSALVNAGRFRPQEENVARAARLAAEIQLLRISKHDLPKLEYADPQLLARMKIPGFVLKAVTPDEKASPLRKLQKARAGDLLIANEKHREVIQVGQWDDRIFDEAIRLPAAVAASLAEAVEEPADRVKVFERWVDQMKALEKVVAERLEQNRAGKYDVHLAKAARLEAEIAVVKAREAIKRNGP